MEKTLDKIVALAKSRGFVYPGSEIYGGLANTWDYGNLGVELKNNVKKAWWQKFIQENPYNVGVDCAILMNPQTWVASGHLGNFSDPLMDCKECKERFRADKLIEDFAMEKDNYTPGTYSFVDASNQTQTTTVDHGVSTKGQMVPRVIKTNVGDIYTTNCLGVAGVKNATTNGIDVEVGDELTPSNTGYLNVANDAANADMVWKVVKVYTMPDNQPGVKLQRIK